MGILNVTPDSFYDGGACETEAAQLQRCEKLLSEGASIIDIGGCSTRPGGGRVDESEECRRVFAALKTIRSHFPRTLLSVDTFRSEVALRSVQEFGVEIINDVSGGSADPKMFETVASLPAVYVLSHHPDADSHPASFGAHIVDRVSHYFEVQLTALRNLGMKEVVLDPGFGFGKTVSENFALLHGLDRFSRFSLPLLIGVSRKRMVSETLSCVASEALNGTTALHTIALLNGASILRVHDVKEALESVQIVEKYVSCNPIKMQQP